MNIEELLSQHESELKPIEARHRKEIRELQKQCHHDSGVDRPFPNQSFVRCLNCHKKWEEVK